jgi:hypothetical protein
VQLGVRIRMLTLERIDDASRIGRGFHSMAD